MQICLHCSAGIKMEDSNLKVAIVGMSHLGLVTTAALASKNIKVHAFDTDEILITSLLSLDIGIEEPRLKSFLSLHKDFITFSHNFALLSEFNVVLVTQDVDTNDSNLSDLSKINKILDLINKNISRKSCLVILSQIPPGFSRDVSARIKCPLVYQVETLVFGSAIQRATNPERFILGLADRNQELNKDYLSVLEIFNCPILIMEYESAELTKISINAYLASSVTVTNLLAKKCEEIGADWDQIIPALQLDKRIGKYAYLNPGLGISGGNIERDLITIKEIGEKSSIENTLINKIIDFNDDRKIWPQKILESIYLTNQISDFKVCIFGVSYKKNTNSVKNSPALKLVQALNSKYEITLSDPIIKKLLVGESYIQVCSDPLVAVKDADALVILTDWDEYKNFNGKDILKLMRGNLIIDPYKVISRNNRHGMQYFTLGVRNPKNIFELT